MYEHHSARVITRAEFARRMLRHGGAVAAILGFSLLLGMMGYVTLARMKWVDAFLNTAMLLGGMGPVGDLPNDRSKIFAGIYALYAGVVFITSAAVLAAPVIHRILHKLHAVKR